MKYDREEAYLHEKLTGGLHPAGVDLWPAVAEHLPDAPPARHPRWQLAICLAAPLLIAAGVLAGTAEFTNLRENPRPSFAPEANTGYAIKYERQYFALDEDLLAGMVANHNGEMSDDGWLPMNGGSTLGNLQSHTLPIPMADIGCAQFAMHSAVETASVADAEAMTKAVAAFYRVHLRALGDGTYTLE